MVITIQHAVGDLPAILTTLADTMRQRAEMRQEVLAATAQRAASSVIITALPCQRIWYFCRPTSIRSPT
jgi:Flp pilus assembly protein TadB